MNKFDTNIQELKYKVLREVASRAWNDTLETTTLDIPKAIIPGNTPTMRCCVYMERAILGERVKLALGGDTQNDNIVEVIEIACDQCPMGGYEITNSCRGCLAHHCEKACKFGAITFDHEKKAHIDKSKCKECGQCAKVCPFNAVLNQRRPCETACKVKAISVGEDRAAKIDEEKCISCGACVYQCPFGAIQDKSYILQAIKLLKQKEQRVYAVVAPSISSQFVHAKSGQVIEGLYKLGFYHVVEAAMGADVVAYKEAQEFAGKDFLTSSCCPAFVDYIKKEFPELEDHISHNLSPGAVTAQLIKEAHPDSKVIFIGPCLAKKKEYNDEKLEGLIDCTITFEELQALLDSRDIDITQLEEATLNNASYYGRIFARSGGVSDAVAQSIKEQNLEADYRPVPCDGIEECRVALLKASKGVLKGNFIEGMACQGGCIGGAGCLTHGPKDKSQIDRYGEEALEKTILHSVSLSEIIK